MSTESIKACMADSDAPGAVEETPELEAPQPIGEGLGVFRALLLTVLFYIVSGLLVWLAWHAVQLLRGH